MKITEKYAVVEFSKAVLENYNHVVIFESDSIKECEYFIQNYCDEGSTVGHTIVENREDGIYNYYTGEIFEMKTY